MWVDLVRPFVGNSRCQDLQFFPYWLVRCPRELLQFPGENKGRGCGIWGASGRRPWGGGRLTRHLLCIWALKLPVVLWYACFQVCLKNPQLSFTRQISCLLPSEKSSRELGKGSRNLVLNSCQPIFFYFPSPSHFQRYLEPPIPRPFKGSAI